MRGICGESMCSVSYTHLDVYKRQGQIWVYDFSKRLEQESNDEIIPYLDYAFFSYTTRSMSLSMHMLVAVVSMTASPS